MALAVTVAQGPTVAARSTAPPNPCRLLKPSEIKKVFRMKVASGSRNVGLCVWDLGGGIAKKGGGSVSVEVDKGPGAAQNFEGFSTAGEVIEGMGDRAFYGPGSSLGFNVLKGDTYIRVSVAFGLLGKGPNEAQQRDRLAKLTKIALNRI